MLIVLPIRTETVIRRTPQANYAIIAANVVCFLLFDGTLTGEGLHAFGRQHLTLYLDQPHFHEFFTYQFLHADTWHLLSNMLFLWVFGNGVNAKLGDVPYVLFYLACGVFSAWGFSIMSPGPTSLVGASGAIAGITTAYLALFPRSHVTVLIWLFIFLHFIQVPAMIIILVKIVVWDNVVAPILLHGNESVAYGAHLAGYFFGFAGALGMLFFRAVPRDHFDILSLWKRWNQRREFAAAMSDPAARARAQFGAVGQVAPQDPAAMEKESRRLDELTAMRSRLVEALEDDREEEAFECYEKLLASEARQCLSEQHQLDMARRLYRAGRFAQAADAFERFSQSYAASTEAVNVQLLLGIIYARDLRDYELADKHLASCLKRLRDDARIAQCREWLDSVRTAMGKPLEGA